MKRILVLFILVAITAQAELPYKLPAKAKYTATPEEIEKAKSNLSTNLIADPNVLTNLFSSPMMCGPGLWNILKDSPHFSKPLIAKGTIKVPHPKGKAQELPAGLLQTEVEADSFRGALADLLKSQGTLIFREPNKDEFMTFWSVSPFDKISGPLLVAEGKDVTIFCEFGKKDRVIWADEVKKMHLKK